jgi:DNA-binding MarR family transcriptional regulator
MDTKQLVNRLGALGLALSDVQERAACETANLSSSGCATIVYLGQYPEETITALSRVLALTHSVCVRLVESLVNDGLLVRAMGKDKRQVRLRLTPKGKKLHRAILKARHAALNQAISHFSDTEHESLGLAVSKMLQTLTLGSPQADHMCRLCDETACDLTSCPVEQKAMQLEMARA